MTTNGDGQPTPERSKPESFRARTLSASLTVNDLRKSMDWYQNVAGFTVGERYEREGELRGAVLIAGNIEIMIGQDDGAKGWDRVKGQGFSLYFTTVQDVDELAARITDHGWTLESEPADMPWGARVFRVKDPDGFTLVIASEASEA
jgi:uncharacterized glyoxalase superfamily protein PhnB